MIPYYVLVLCAAHVACKIPEHFWAGRFHADSVEECESKIKLMMAYDRQRPEDFIVICSVKEVNNQ